MIKPDDELEWEDGTPVTGSVKWSGNAPRRTVYVSSANGAQSELVGRGGRPSGYYNEWDGGYSGSESMFQKLRPAAPRGPEVYEEWFK